MKYLISITLLFTINLNLYTQVTNSYKSDKTGIYFFSLDSMVQILKNQIDINRVIISSDNIYRDHEAFPDSIGDLNLIEINSDNPFKLKHMNQNDIYISELKLGIIKDKILLSMVLQRKIGEELVQYKGGLFIFHFEFFSASEFYKMVGFFEGSMVIHHYKKVDKIK